MSKICDVCGLPEELCVCEEIAREVQAVKVYTVRRRFGKLMTIVEGIDEHDIDIKELTKTLKAKCACGGTAKKGQVVKAVVVRTKKPIKRAMVIIHKTRIGLL